MNNYAYAGVLAVVLVLIVVLGIYTSSSRRMESFCGMCPPYRGSYPRGCHQWGYGGNELMEVNTTPLNWVGPDPTQNRLNMWQYTPNRSLVDYKVYEFTKTPDVSNSLRLEPTAHANIGKNVQCPYESADPFGSPMGTRIPDNYSNNQAYVVPQSLLA